MKKIYLVTGGTGFVGGSVIRAIEEKGEKVRTLIRSKKKAETALKGSSAEFVQGDVRDLDALERLFDNKGEPCEFVCIHAASIVLIGGGKKEIAEMRDVCINGTNNVIKLCLKYNARLVFVSSVHAFKELPHLKTITESGEFNPSLVKGAYAKVKAEASASIVKAVREQGLNAVLVHPSGVIGPGDFSNTHLTQMVIDYAAGKIPAAVRGGYNFVDVRDVASGIIAAAESGKTGESYLLTNKYYSVKEMLDILYKLTGIKKIKTTFPRILARIAIPFLSLSAKIKKQRLLFTSYTLYTLGSNSNFSNAKAVSELGFNPRTLEDSLRDTVDFVKQNNFI